jgi:hypothetical protein
MITVNTILSLLAKTAGATIGNIEILTPVDLSAGNKKAGNVAAKRSTGSVMLFNNLKETTDPYVNRVLKTIKTDDFTGEWIKGTTYWHHTNECYSLAKHNTKEDYYLALHWNDCSNVEFYLNGEISTREAIASLMTPSGAKGLLDTSGTVFNVTNQVEHDDFVRIVKLENIVSLTANKQTI